MPRLKTRGSLGRRPVPKGGGAPNWQDRGFESKGAAQSVSKQYGLVQQPDGSWGKPDMAFLERQVEPWTNNAYGNSTPVGIGGARWMVGPQGAQFTGQASDAPFGKMPVGNAFDAGKQTPYGAGKLRPNPQQGMPHTQIGQQGAGTGRPNPRGAFSPGGKPGAQLGGASQGAGRFSPKPGGGKPGGKPVGPGPVGAAVAKPGAFPAAPPQVPNYLPMTPGYEAAYRGANDQLAGAEGAYAAAGALIPAQIAQNRARLDTDQSVATDRLKEQLAERGIYTPYGADSTVRDPRMATSPAGGGVGEALYGRQVATPFGRSRQDLGSAAADAYEGRALEYGGAQLGFNQAMLDALLGRANDAFSAMPLSLPIGGYELPEMAGPSFSAPPDGGGVGKPGRNRNRNGNRNRGRGKRGRGRN